MTTRRDFIKSMSAGAVLLYTSDIIGDLIAQSPIGRVLESKFKGLADISLEECRRAGCSYSDIRFTRNLSLPGATAFATNDASVTPDQGGFGRGGRGGGGRGGGGRGGGFGGFGRGGVLEQGDFPDGSPRAAGFGVRVIHGGVWGFASSPIVTEDEIRRISRLAIEIARASAIAKKTDVRLAPVPAYQIYWKTPMDVDPTTMSDSDKRNALQAIVDAAIKQKDVVSASASANFSTEWKYFASSEGSYIEQEIFSTSPNFTVTAKRGDVTRARSLAIPGGTGGWELVELDRMTSSVDQIVDEAIEIAAAKPITPGVKDLVLTPSHLALTIHEIVAHPTELDRVVGYEANYAGTSFCKVSDIGKLKYGSKLFNITGDKVRPGGRATIGYDDDGVKTTQFPIVREGILVGLSSNRETAHFIGEKESRGCTQATTWRDYPFLRMPNVHLDAGPPGSPTPEQIIADTKDGVLIEGSGSFSIDQQRYNGQFGGGAFWEIKNGKKVRAVTNVTYNAITTDFWANMDALTGPEYWQQFGLGGDAKGQPTQSQSVSHGAPWVRIRRIMVGAAYQ
ncbi:MAG TPA: TldD/PmbA family protein [Vicinamibacterales bacterium]|nr:TldD/PmbA family protein [Vicinamibacterales bacterium]